MENQKPQWKAVCGPSQIGAYHVPPIWNVVQTETNTIICEMSGKNQRNNAKLIATAPDMLNALIEVREGLKYAGVTSYHYNLVDNLIKRVTENQEED